MYCQRQMRSQRAATRLGSASRTRWRWRKARCTMTSSNWRSKVWRANRCDDASSTSPTTTSPSKSSTKVRSPAADVTCHVTVASISILFWFGLINSVAWSHIDCVLSSVLSWRFANEVFTLQCVRLRYWQLKRCCNL